MATTDTSTAAGVRWDLTHMFADAAAARAELASAVERAGALVARLDAVDGLTPSELHDLFDEASALASVRELFHDEFGYGSLRLLADASDVEARDLVAESSTGIATVRDALRAFAQTVGDRPALAELPELADYRYWIEHQASLSAARLEPVAEQAFAARTPTASAAWGRLSQEYLMSASVPFDAGAGEQPHNVVDLRLLRRHADRDVRRRALEALLGIYDEKLPVVATCLDSVVADRLTEDRLRGRDDPMAATLALDGVDAATVELVLSSIEGRTDIVTSWYERKRLAMGLEQIEPYDRVAPVGDPVEIPWERAAAACRGVFEDLSARAGEVAAALFDEQRVDAERRHGKDGSVFCVSFAEPSGSYIFLSYLESPVGALFLGHELGHAVHFGLVRSVRPWLAWAEPESAAFAEVPSTLAEILTTERLAATLGGEGGKAVVRECLEGLVNVVFGVAAATRFEQDACARRAAGEAITPERLEEMSLARERAVFGPVAQRLAALNIPHHYLARFYTYQYAYAALSALGLAAIRREDPERFAVDYVAMLEATGSGPPGELLALCGLDVGDPGFWARGLDELDRLAALAW